MYFSQAIDAIARVSPERFSSLADAFSPELIGECLEHAGVATLRKRRLPLGLVDCRHGTFRHIPMGQVVNQLDIVLPGQRPFVAPSAVV
ncbi:transposase domain-containing protein [Halomonas sp. AOP27-A1-41]|uniref:transposase domain-containing protein n=1 Tax=Halomonas sp. AOP27-A1-41 TaxID=3457707 RepID=UPI004034A456